MDFNTKRGECDIIFRLSRDVFKVRTLLRAFGCGPIPLNVRPYVRKAHSV